MALCCPNFQWRFWSSLISTPVLFQEFLIQPVYYYLDWTKIYYFGPTEGQCISKNIISGLISTHCGFNTGFDFVTILADVVSCSSLVCSSGKIQFHYREWVAWVACFLRSKSFWNCMWYFFTLKGDWAWEEFIFF